MTTNVEVEIDGKTYTLKAAVTENLPKYALLCTDVIDLVRMIVQEDRNRTQQVLGVTT